MILQGRFSHRRKILAAVMVVFLCWLGYTRYVGLAIAEGVQFKDMDWNGDGTVSRQEILQAFYAVAVRHTHDNQRQCATYYWRRSGEQIRVDCRTVFEREAVH
ncbi:MAG TPA: EF-hand domain-containing protein [Xylella sp.]